VKPLFLISSPSPSQGIGAKESQREAKPLLYIHSPFPLIRGRGIQGDRVTEQNIKGVRLISNLNVNCFALAITMIK